MIFNDEQNSRINEFLKNYHKYDVQKESSLSQYLVEPGKLDILKIYALEEILRVGNKGIFAQFINSISPKKTLAQTIIEYEELGLLLIEDIDFFEKMLNRYALKDKALTKMERFRLRLIYDDNLKKPKTLTYEEFNPIKFTSDEDIRETFYNLLFGRLIHNLLENELFKSIREKQLEKGQIASVDKPLVLALMQEALEEFAQTSLKAEKELKEIKKRISEGLKEASFGEYLQFNTNISYRDILGYKKDPEEIKLILAKPVSE